MPLSKRISTLTDGIFETGAYAVPSKSQNPFWVKVVHHPVLDGADGTIIAKSQTNVLIEKSY